MPGAIVHLSATVLCVHGAQATPMAPNPRVSVSGQPISTLATSYVVSGCPSTGYNKCVTAQWVQGAARVTADGQPVVIVGGQAVCAPSGGPLNVLATQARVVAT